MPVSNIRTKRKVVSALRKYARTMDSWVRFIKGTSKLRGQTANSFLLGVMLDRNIPFQRAWDGGEWIADAVGDESDVTVLWKSLRDMEPKRLRGFLRYGFGGQAFHRHYKTFARTLPKAAVHILENYGGDPRRIWNGQRDISVVRQRLDAVPNIGQGLANMALLHLVRNCGLLGGKKARPQLDLKPDIHVRRVFYRGGLVSKGCSDQDLIRAGRDLAPGFPAALDAPAWDIGRLWCRPNRPKCAECPIGSVCPRVGRP